MAENGVKIDQGAFCARLKALYKSWKDNAELWGNVNAFAIPSGATSEELRYTKSLASQLWLFGYELPDTIMMFLKQGLHVITSGKKATLLQGLVDAAQSDAGVQLTFHVKPKGEDGASQVQEVLALAKDSTAGGPFGTLTKEKPEGKLMEVWNRCLSESGMETVDIAHGLADCLSVKDEAEVKNIKKAALLCWSAMKNFSVPQLEAIIDEEKKVKHSKLSEKTEEVITDPAKIKVKLLTDNVDIAYPPIYQSGGQYDLKVSAQSDDMALHYGVILVSLGARYSMYCANVARTYLVDPSPKQEAEYRALLDAQDAAVKALVEGAQMNAAYEAVVTTLQEKGQAHLVEKLPKNIGFGMGLEFREGTNVLNSKNANLVRPGMAFNVAVGVQGLERSDAPDPKGKAYALLVADTVVVAPGGAHAEVVTAGAPKTWKEVAYYLDDDEEEEEEVQGELQKRPGGRGAESGSNYQDRKAALRSKEDDFEYKQAERRKQKENQEELLRRINEETKRALVHGGAGGRDHAQGGRRVSEITAYRSVADMMATSSLQVQVDHRKEAVLVPIYGVLVPFHVLTVKNAQNNQDGDKAYIRINFNFGASFEPGQRHPGLIFLKELSFRTLDTKHAVKVVQEIKALRAAVSSREKERAERASLVQQEKLVRSKGRVYSLSDVWVRPAIATGKGRKFTGTLEAHSNGFRYSLPDGTTLDIMYRNIRHAFFQPAENDLMTIVHFHLVDPIMAGKKKTNDMQFYTEVMDVGETLDAGRRNNYDPDEIEEEQRDRERRNRINKTFQAFVKRVQTDIWERDYADLELEFEIPFRELGFQGIPYKTRSMTTIYPTVNCLVELTETPFTVMTMADVQLVSLERVGFNLRQFDMVVVFKDLTREVFTISAVDAKSLDTIKEWLTSMDIKYYENKLNLQWRNILKSILEDPEGFLGNGGWSFLDQEKSDSEEEEESEDGDEEFAPDAAGGSGPEEEEDEDESSEDESLVDSAEEEEEEDSDFDEEDEEAAGMSWEELEREAKEDDRERGYVSDDSEDRGGKKRKAGGQGGGGGGAPAKRRR